MKFSLLSIMLFLITQLTINAETGRYRLSWRDAPITTMVIGWESINGNSATVYYDTVDHGDNIDAYKLQKGYDRSVDTKGMTHQFARLTGLLPDTAYYFVIVDSNSVSNRYWFKTAADSHKPFSVVAGSDSRNNREPRKNANLIVSKVRPLFVFFGGDFTNTDSNIQWQEWLDDWQKTISSDGRMYPILPARGNHDSDSVIHNIFDTPHAKNYHAYTFGRNLLRAYTLNSEITEGGTQGDWLKNDLESKGQAVTFRMAQYHKSMKPHNSGQSEGNYEYNAWAHTFYDNNVDLVVESDGNMVKRTYPIRPATGSNSDQGFQRDDAKGTYYIGEGCWGATLRAANDDKEWTMASGSFNQCNWIQIHPDRMEVRTIKVNNASEVDSVTENNPFTPPKNIDIWNDTLTIEARNEMLAEVILTEPEDNAIYNPDSVINMAADTSSDIDVVRFWVTEESGDAYVIETDNTPPFEYSTDELTPGKYTIHARGKDSNGKAYDSQTSTITIRESNTYVSLTSPQDNSTFNSENEFKMAADTSSDINVVRFWVTPETGDSYVIEVDKQAPFEFKTNSLLPGKYEIRAIGKDADGITYATQEAAIEILPPSNKVTLVNPSNGSIYESDESINMAADTSSDIDVVRFWVTPENGTPYVIHTDNEQPFEYIANNLPAGKYSLHARGIDNSGNSHDSETVGITVNEPIQNDDISNWENYSTTEIKIERIREWQSINYTKSQVGTTEFLLLSTSHGNPPDDQMLYKHEVRGGSWLKISYAGNDDKSLEVWMRHVNNSNVNDMGELDVKGGNGKLTLLTYNNILNTGNIVNKNQLSASTIKITNSGSAPFLVVAASDNGGDSNIANAEHFIGDDIVFIYLTESASFKDSSVSKFRGAISSIQLK